MAFSPSSSWASKPRRSGSALCLSSSSSRPKVLPVAVDVFLGDGYKTASLNFLPLFESSSFFTVTYDVPFGLNIEKPPRGFPAPVVSKDGPKEGGEKAGDVLRATTCWTHGFEAAGAASDIMAFAGNIRWRKSIFDCTSAPWEEVVKALQSNTSERSKTVTLVFERETSDDPKPEQ
eukprot:gene8567-9440_t